MYKRDILEKFEKIILEKIKMQQEALNNTKQASIEAPSAMESASDTTKSQMDWLAESILIRISELNKLILEIQVLFSDLPKCEKVCIGALVKIKKENKEFRYFVIKYGGGVEIETTDGKIIAISLSAPIVKSIFGLKTGSSVDFLNDKIKIITVK